MPNSSPRSPSIHAFSAAALGATLCFVAQISGCFLKSSARTTDPPPDGQIPCDADRVLKTVCQKCHSSPPQNMAPFSLVTYADTHAIDAPSGKPIWSFMLTAVTNGIMPLSPVTIGPDDKRVLLDWLNAGAPAAGPSDSCSAADPPPEGGSDGGAPDATADAIDPHESGVLPPDANDVDLWSTWDCSTEASPGDAAWPPDSTSGNDAMDVDAGDPGEPPGDDGPTE